MSAAWSPGITDRLCGSRCRTATPTINPATLAITTCIRVCVSSKSFEREPPSTDIKKMPTQYALSR